MFLLYSIAYSLGFIAMLPAFLLRHEKYLSGFRERLGIYSEFKQDERKVIWLHCVSVGETNAARPLVDELLSEFPSRRLVVSTTTRTGQELAKKVFRDEADAIFYFPFDWKFSVLRALRRFKPSLILLMETEIWPRLISEAKRAGVQVAIVNGRLSSRSSKRLAIVRRFAASILQNLDLALMQSESDAGRFVSLGMPVEKVTVTGNLKFDLTSDDVESRLTEVLQQRFRLHGARPVIVAASTHEPEERLLLDSLRHILPHHAKLFIVPRHPQRFDDVFELLKQSPYRVARRSQPEAESDRSSDVILIDSIGELRAIYPLADIVFVGGSLIPHGGQSILEPASAGKPIMTGPHTFNFEDATRAFLDGDALIQIPELANEQALIARLEREFDQLLHDPARRKELGQNSLKVMAANRGATGRTIGRLRQLLEAQ